ESRTIPHRKSGVRFDIQGVHVSVADFLPFRIISRLKGSPVYQSSRGSCAPNESQQRLPGSQGHASPVATDLAKQSVLDGIPLGAPSWIVAHRHGQSETIANFHLEALFPSTDTAAITATGVCQHQEV